MGVYTSNEQGCRASTKGATLRLVWGCDGDMSAKRTFRKMCRRYNDPGHAHELTFSCYKRRPFLTKDRIRNYLAEAIVRAKEKHRFDVWGYVFMPEHVHLLIWPHEVEYSISRILLSIKQSVSRRALLHLGRYRPEGLKWVATGQKHTPYRFWLAGGGYDRNITAARTVVDVAEYIHNNPVRRGLVARPEDWPWSSARHWQGRGPGPVPIDRDSFPVL